MDVSSDIMCFSLPSPPLSEQRRYSGARRPCVCVCVCVCVSAEPRLHAVGGEGNALYQCSLDNGFIIIAVLNMKLLRFSPSTAVGFGLPLQLLVK